MTRYRFYIALVMSMIQIHLLGCKLNSVANEKAVGKWNAPAASSIALFKDKMDFNLDDVKHGKVCGSLKNGKLQLTYEVWPRDMKQFLAQEVSRFEYFKMVAPYVEGIYLVNFAPDLALGMTCHDAKTNKYVVFVNTSQILIERDNSHLDISRYIQDGRTQGIPLLQNVGDGAVQTLIHEFFHVVDLAYYWDDFVELMNEKTPKNPQSAAVRRGIFNLSWRADGGTLFDKDLGQEATDVPHSTNAGGQAQDAGLVENTSGVKSAISLSIPDHIEVGLARHKKPRSSLGLAEDDELQAVKKYQKRLQTIADKTNFVDDYASTNFAEDFAVTFDQYYLGTRYDMWKRYEFFAPLQPYVFTAKDSLSRNSAQHRKLCTMLKNVFNETCRYVTPGNEDKATKTAVTSLCLQNGAPLTKRS